MFGVRNKRIAGFKQKNPKPSTTAAGFAENPVAAREEPLIPAGFKVKKPSTSTNPQPISAGYNPETRLGGREFEEADPEKLRNQALQRAALSQQLRRKAEQEGRADTESFLRRPQEGLNPEARQAMQYEAERNIEREEAANMRHLLGEQSRRGIIGKGGIPYAQQRNLQNVSREARGQLTRDLTRLDKDLELKNKAAIFAGGKGEAAQSLLDQQQAIDELELAEEKRRQRLKERELSNYLYNVRA